MGFIIPPVLRMFVFDIMLYIFQSSMAKIEALWKGSGLYFEFIPCQRAEGRYPTRLSDTT